MALTFLKRISFSLWALCLGLSALGQIPSGYYNNASNKSGETLRAALRDITTNGSVKLPYTSSSFDVWDAYGQTDVRPGTNKIWDMYSDIPNGTPQYTYTLYADQCGTAAAEGSCYAREHQVPNSWWGGLDDAAHPQYSDLHHLPPADQYVNNNKSAHPIGKVGAAGYVSSNGSKVGACAWPGYTGTVFEPIDEYKGDFARAYLYVATRYMNQLSSWVTSYPGTESQYVINSTGNNYKQWYIDMLIQWHMMDPVSQKELDRNDAIYYNTPQHNRNPYIDHPEYVCMVWSSTSCVSGPVISAVSQNPLVATATTAVDITATVTSSIGVASVTVDWGSDGINFPNSISTTQTASTNDFVTDTSLPAQAAGSTVYYKIIAEDNQGNVTSSSVRNYYVLKDEPTNYPSSFACGAVTGSAITVTWTDATGSSVPDGYLVKASSVSYAAIAAPSDSVPEANGSFVKNVAAGVQQAVFSGLGSSIAYYFRIYPFTNSGTGINYKKSTAPPSVSCTTSVASGGSSCATDLIISEYVEGSSNNKFIEIYNNTGGPVNLADYRLRLYTNGSLTASSDVQLSGTLNNLSSIVYKNSGASTTLFTGTAISNAAVNFNGNDAVALYKISAAANVDIFGRIGEDPGTSWTSGSMTTLDKTLVRNANVYSGVTANPSSGFPTLASEWTQYNIDDVSNLGTHTMNCPVCATPSQNSSSISFSSVTDTSMTISWTNGDGAKRLVVIRDSAAVSGNPEEGITYSANSAFGSGPTLAPREYIIYNGSGSSVSVTRLSGGHTYFISVFEYNCAPGAQLYLTPGASASKVTYSISTGAPSDGQYCVTSATGASASVDYSSTGTFTANTFTVQLSDLNGSFVSPVNIASMASNAGSGTINCSIPAGTANGTGYKMRVISSNPYVIGSPGPAFEVILSPVATAPTSLASDRSGFCSSDSGSITLTATGGSGTELRWYSGVCGGTYLGSGNPLVIESPSSTTTYYASWGTTCSNSPCASVIVSVSGLPAASAGTAISSCNGTASVSMTGATNETLSNNWSGGEALGSWTQNANPSLASFTPSTPAGSFLATLTVYSSGSCSGLSASYTRKISWGSSGSWTGASNGDWSNSSNWCGGVPTSSRDVYIPPSAHVLNTPAINLSGAVCLSMNLSGSLTFSGSGTLDVYGNWATNGGSLSAATGVITFRGFSKTIGGTAQTVFPALQFNAGSSYTMNNSNSCSGLSILSGSASSSLVLSSGITFNINGNALINQLSTSSGSNIWNIGSAVADVSGNLTIGSGGSNSGRIAKVVIAGGSLAVGGNIIFNTPTSASAILDLSGGASTVNLSGAITKSSAGTLTPGTQSTFTFNGTAAGQTVTLGAGFAYNNIQLNNTHASGVTLGGSVTSTNVLGNILLQAGQLSNGGYSVAGNLTKQFSIGAGCMYKLTAATGMPTGFGTLNIGANSTVEFAGSSSQTIAALNYANLISTNTGVRTLASSGTIAIAGNFSPGTNTYTTTGSTVNFNGTGQTVPEINASAGYNNVSIAQASGMATVSGNVKLAGTLNLSAGLLNLGSGTLTLTGSAAIGGSPFSASKMIIADEGGEFRKTFSSNTSYLFPVGDNNGDPEYSPVTLSFSSGTYGAGAYAGIRVTNQKHPQTSNIANYLNRYWSVSPSGISNAVYSVSAVYVPADVIGSDSSVFMYRYSGALPWVKYAAANTSSKTLTAAGLTVITASDYSGFAAGNISVSIQGGGVALCSGDSVSVTALPSGTGPFTYAWSPATGISDVTKASPVLYPSATTVYTVTVTDGSGSVASASTTITVNPVPAAVISPSGTVGLCRGSSLTLSSSAGASYLWNTGATTRSISVSTAGKYAVEVTSISGCTGISDTVTVFVKEITSGSESITVCSSSLPLVWNGLSLMASGVYQDTLTNEAGCDSIVTLHLTVLPSGYFRDSVSACNSYLLPWGQTALTSGTYSKTYPAAAASGCDSILIIKVTVFSSTKNSFLVTQCGSYSWNNKVYTESGTYIHEYINANSCPSADTLKLTVLAVTNNVSNVSACDSYSWNGTLYKSSGTFTYPYTNTAGCASVDTLKLTIRSSSRNATTASGCTNYLWALNGMAYTQSGTYSYNYTNDAGCPSSDTLKLTIYQGSSSTVNASSCDTYTWSLNGQTYTQSGNYTYNTGMSVTPGGSVRISQVYGGGGGSTGTYQRDYVELFNSSCSEINIGGWAIEYGSATGRWGSTSSNILVFPSGTLIQPKKYLLIQFGSIGSGSSLPVTPDLADTTKLNMSATSGKVALFNAVNSNLACDSVISGTLVDKVSYGTGNCPEGTATAALSSTTVLVRKNGGEVDGNANSADFEIIPAANVSPRNSASAANAFAPCGTCSRTVLQLTINGSSVQRDTVGVCESYMWPKNNVIYTQGGVYAAVSGCTTNWLHLTVNKGTFIKSDVSACDSYSWRDTVYFQSGKYVHSYLNASGCASADTLDLIVNALPSAGSVSGPGSLCIGSSGSFSASGGAGYWRSGNPAVLSIDSLTGVVVAMAAGISEVRRIATSVACGTDTARLSVSVIGCQSVLHLKLFIEGYYVSTDSMRPVLYNSGVSGAGMTQCDTVMVEMRDTSSGLLLAGPIPGILSTNGSLSLIIPSLSGSNYIVIRHRNALETWSAQPVIMGPAVNYDFTTSASAAYGDNMIEMSTGQFALRSGDLNGDGLIESEDYTLLGNDVLSILFGYQVSDLNGDGVVESADFSLMENNILQTIFALRPF